MLARSPRRPRGPVRPPARHPLDRERSVASRLRRGPRLVEPGPAGAGRRSLDDDRLRPLGDLLATRGVLLLERRDALDEVLLAVAAEERPRAAVGGDLRELALLRRELRAPRRPDRADLGDRPDPALLLDGRAAPRERLADLAGDDLRRVVEEERVVVDVAGRR